MFNIGPLELLLVALVALIVVGPKRLPELGKTIGKGLREFRKAQDELRRSVDLGIDEPKPTFDRPRPDPDDAGPRTRGNPGVDRYDHPEEHEDDPVDDDLGDGPTGEGDVTSDETPDDASDLPEPDGHDDAPTPEDDRRRT